MESGQIECGIPYIDKDGTRTFIHLTNLPIAYCLHMCGLTMNVCDLVIALLGKPKSDSLTSMTTMPI